MEKATHWIDDRKLVLTNAEREELGSDYQNAYNVPCRMARGKAKPLHICPACNGTGDEPGAEYDRCDKCHGAGGLPHNVEFSGGAPLHGAASAGTQG